MNETVMREFISSDSLALHLSYLKKLYLKYSILKKSIQVLNGCALEDIVHLRIPRDVRDEAYKLLSEIESHKCYFNSFEKCIARCENLCRLFGSEDAFLYELIECAKSTDKAFLYIYTNGRGVEILTEKPTNAYKKSRPVLALDLCEHAYFSDYGFDREKYITAAIRCLNIQKLDKALNCP